jgi:hypothetical protein
LGRPVRRLALIGIEPGGLSKSVEKSNLEKHERDLIAIEVAFKFEKQGSEEVVVDKETRISHEMGLRPKAEAAEDFERLVRC